METWMIPSTLRSEKDEFLSESLAVGRKERNDTYLPCSLMSVSAVNETRKIR